MKTVDDNALKEIVITALKTVYDPELPVNLYDMGLFYNIEFGEASSGGKSCLITMTLTSPGCSVSDTLVENVYAVTREIKQLDEVYVELTFEPPWDPTMMSEEAQLHVAMM
ncbi:MAG: DUF59 domain-containing protein [Sulfurospirillum sp.]|nr:DUF59 domain-containing protein [Sulfurospirillum sp.]